MPKLPLFMLVFASSALSQAPSALGDEPAPSLESNAERGRQASQPAEMIDLLEAQALRYQEDGRHALVAQTIQRALDIVRANYGLYSLEQVALIRQSIENEKARGHHGAAWDLQQELLNLIHRHPDDLTTVPTLREIADERIDTLERYAAGELPPEIVLGCYYTSANAAFGRCTSGSKGAAMRHILQEASRYYEDAIAVLLRNGLYSSGELRALELKLIRANYFYGAELHPPGRYEQGKERLRRLVRYGAEGSETFNEIDALVQIGDWDLMYSNHAKALKTYQHAYDRLVQEEIAQESMDRLFAPNPPAILPVFLPNPLISGKTPQSTGFIDAAFEITRFGRSRQIEILDTTMNATETDKERLLDLIAGSRFRPRTEDGSFGRAESVTVRYYLNE